MLPGMPRYHDELEKLHDDGSGCDDGESGLQATIVRSIGALRVLETTYQMMHKQLIILDITDGIQ
jgi:hypothetical protein